MTKNIKLKKIYDKTFKNKNRVRETDEFEEVLKMESWKGKIILDVGCGLATYKEFLDSQKIKYKSYTGIDILEEFIVNNKKKFSDCDFFYGTLDDFAELNTKKFDVITFCQVFNNNLSDTDNMDLVQSQISLAFSMTNHMVSCDFISNYVNYNDDFLYYYSPESIFSFCKSLTPFARLLLTAS